MSSDIYKSKVRERCADNRQSGVVMLRNATLRPPRWPQQRPQPAQYETFCKRLPLLFFLCYGVNWSLCDVAGTADEGWERRGECVVSRTGDILTSSHRST